MAASILGAGSFGCSLKSRGGPTQFGYPVSSESPTVEGPNDPRLNTENYNRITDNPFLAARDNPVSTFSVDVDTASYSNVRRFLMDGQLPPPDAVRVEELVNYFHYAYPEPRDAAPVALATEVGPCPWQPDHRLVRLGLKARSVPRESAPPRNLTFLIDVSGSMDDARKLPLLKRALALLVENLTERDRIAIVVYAGASGVVLPPTSASEKGRIVESLENLHAGGSTNGGDGILLAYRVARDMMHAGGAGRSVNRVILATDGDFNVGISSQGDLERLIEKEREGGVFLTVLGFGMGNLKDSTLETLADKGNGNYAYIDTMTEARRVLGEDVAGTLITVAKDVKIQVEFNPAEVESYRLIGYENRMLRREDFANDKIDAAEMGAGQTVTALYEIAPARGHRAGVGAGLKYQELANLSAAASSGELGTIKFRYKAPTGSQSQELAATVRDDGLTVDATSPGFRFAAGVAAFGMVLRESPHKGSATMELVRSLASRSDADERQREFAQLVDKAGGLRSKSQ